MKSSLGILFFVISVSSISCRVLPELSCDFDGNFCNYELFDESFSTEVSIRDGSPRSSDALDGPLQGQEGSGTFLQLNSTRDHTFYGYNWTAQLVSPRVELSGEYCISLDYHLISPTGSMHIFAARERNTIMRDQYHLFTRSRAASYADKWQHFQQTVSFASAHYEIAIYAHNVAALDNLQFKDGPCLNQNELVKCDFDNIQNSDNEGGLGCAFLERLPPPDENGTEFDHWRLSRRSFINSDHTTGTRYGRFLSAFGATDLLSLGMHFSDLLLHRAEPSDGIRCLSLMMKSDTVQWKIFERAPHSGVTNILSQYNKEELTSYYFTRKQIEIDPVVPIEIVLGQIRQTPEGQPRQDFDWGYIFIDSIEVRKGRCPPLVDCDFSKNACGLSIEHNTYLTNWLLGSGRVEFPEQLRAPAALRNADVTKSYLYTDFTTDRLMYSNGFATPFIEDVSNYCFTMEYYAESIPITHIQSHSHRQHHSHEIVASNLTYPDVPRWSRVEMNIRHKAPFYVRLHISEPPHGTKPIFEVNDVKLLKGTCAEAAFRVAHPHEQPDFPQVRFHCYKTGHYISQHLACDGVIDCPMAEDEENCDKHECSMSGIPCKMRRHTFCLKDDRICDGHDDCDDGVDEDPSLCNQDKFQKNYCLNGGEMYFRAYSCRCQPGFIGKRCQKAIDE